MTARSASEARPCECYATGCRCVCHGGGFAVHEALIEGERVTLHRRIKGDDMGYMKCNCTPDHMVSVHGTDQTPCLYEHVTAIIPRRDKSEKDR